MIEKQRTPGKGATFRRLLRALIAASEGNRVLFLVETQILEQFLWRKAVTICDVYLSKDALHLNFVAHKITFPNGGAVTFATPLRDQRGMQYEVEINDAGF